MIDQGPVGSRFRHLFYIFDHSYSSCKNELHKIHAIQSGYSLHVFVNVSGMSLTTNMFGREEKMAKNFLFALLYSIYTNTINKKDAPLNKKPFIGLKCMENVC